MTRRYLSEAELSSFHRDGFLVIRQMYSHREIGELSRWIDDLFARRHEIGRQMTYYEDSLLTRGGKILSRIENFVDDHDRFRAFVYDDRMVGRVNELFGEPSVLFKEKVNFKLSGGDGFKPHQDIQPGWDAYASYFISVLVTVDDSTELNGCLELAAGHHVRGRIGEKWRPLENGELDGIVFEKCPMAPGDVVYFDCFVPHRSGPNLTDGPRRNLYLTYNRLSEGDRRKQYFADKRKSFPPDNEREPGKEYVFRV